MDNIKLHIKEIQSYEDFQNETKYTVNAKMGKKDKTVFIRYEHEGIKVNIKVKNEKIEISQEENGISKNILIFIENKPWQYRLYTEVGNIDIKISTQKIEYSYEPLHLYLKYDVLMNEKKISTNEYHYNLDL
ncbi:hypothetical protein AN639_04875 [Candidatus Epulonipiscium fishelsonii]|uniref:Uncharacterized protein n=1 Tax=Candidatus Epulonipiscium fishelsonii TaxID=77094 RepID=A0ACC8XDE0_9FIRM|nr:hypothetical protein AN639_04875 [Epulopiscium sp. SCG-B05WGA-EpuloA1]ONI40813.1 hypothetical protein AN396_05180 [Epulopiscium sp. SCG-B11WGA-EpuloA1]